MTDVSVPRAAYSLITEELLAAKVDKIFGLVGEDTVLFVADAASRGITYVGARHEAGAVGMADGYSWASGELGVCTVTRGPGMTNAMTAARTAVQGKRRVLIITGDVPTGGGGPYLKNIDMGPLARSVGLEYFDAATLSDVVPQFRSALACAREGRTAVLAVAADVLNAGIDADYTVDAPTPLPTPPTPTAASDDDVHAIVNMFAKASRPLIMAGLGACTPECRDLMIRLAEITGGLLGTSLLAKGLFNSSVYDSGVVGGFTVDPSVPILGAVDLVLVVGASLNAYSLAQDTLFLGVPIVQIDHHAHQIGMTRPVERAVVGDARLTLEKLVATIDAPATQAPFHDEEFLQAMHGAKFEGELHNVLDRLDPTSAALALDEALPIDRVVVLDSGRFTAGPGRYVGVSAPGSVRTTADAGSIGTGLAIAIGASVARPGRPTVLFAGDGGLSMSIAELETIARHDANLVIVVMDDNAYGSEMRVLAEAQLPVDMARLPAIDFAAVARALGIDAITARNSEDLERVKDAVRSRTGPLLVHCLIRSDMAASRASWPQTTATR
jgi:thiamine pyrophosphate-dependent acetolactate synthase large subunit-like protein